MRDNLLLTLRKVELRNELISHPLFQEIKERVFTKTQVAALLGQWFHPLHYFPTFLSRLISVTPELEMQTVISRVLWEELGEGVPTNAHEAVFVDTMQTVGFGRGELREAPPLAATRRLLDGYREATDNYLAGLGFLYGTEVADLAMVSAIGHSVRRACGEGDLPWVDIHVKQEPGHVKNANQTLEVTFSDEERAEIIRNAEKMWRLWIDFFSNIQEEMGQSAAVVQVAAEGKGVEVAQLA